MLRGTLVETVVDPMPNPWISIWHEPRLTIERIVARDPKYCVLLLASLSGIAQTLDGAVERSLGDDVPWPFLLGTAAIGGPITGLLGLFVGSWLLKLTGGWMGGRGDALRIRTAIAWGSAPIVWGLLLWIPLLLVFGQELFATETPLMDSSPGLLALYVGFAALDVVISVWSIVVFLHCLGQVQGFSAWRALGNTLAAVAVIAVPIVLLALLFAGLSV